MLARRSRTSSAMCSISFVAELGIVAWLLLVVEPGALITVGERGAEKESLLRFIPVLKLLHTRETGRSQATILAVNSNNLP